MKKMNEETLIAKFKGAMIGTAVGDALGSAFEGQRQVLEAEIIASALDRKVLKYTDDTHMMIGVAESLIANRGFNGDHMAHRFADNFYQDPFRGYGAWPPRVFGMIAAGQPWDKASENLPHGGSYGNGAAMRIAPVGLYYHDDPQTLKEIAQTSSHITHAHPLGKEGAVLQACAIGMAANLDATASFRPEEFLSKLMETAQEDIYKRKLDKIETLLSTPNQGKVIDELGNGVAALDSVPSAIFSFLAHPRSFEKTVTYAIGLGGDTDTIGAMAGAISGAYLGVVTIPEKWHAKLENSLYIEGLAEKLWKSKSPI